jgi:hypothetical protein
MAKIWQNTIFGRHTRTPAFSTVNNCELDSDMGIRQVVVTSRRWPNFNRGLATGNWQPATVNR